MTIDIDKIEYIVHIGIENPLQADAAPVSDTGERKENFGQSEKNLEQVKQKLDKKGVTIVDWAKKHGYSYQAIQRVLSGHAACKRGQVHDIAVLLGLKEGELTKK